MPLAICMGIVQQLLTYSSLLRGHLRLGHAPAAAIAASLAQMSHPPRLWLCCSALWYPCRVGGTWSSCSATRPPCSRRPWQQRRQRRLRPSASTSWATCSRACCLLPSLPSLHDYKGVCECYSCQLFDNVPPLSTGPLVAQQSCLSCPVDVASQPACTLLTHALSRAEKRGPVSSSALLQLFERLRSNVAGTLDASASITNARAQTAAAQVRLDRQKVASLEACCQAACQSGA